MKRKTLIIISLCMILSIILVVPSGVNSVVAAGAENKAAGSFSEKAEEIDQLIREAREQYLEEDYTRLSEPVKYRILWIGFTHVKYNEFDFQMTDFDKKYLEAAALNFEKSVEQIVDHNLDIEIDLHFVDTIKDLTLDSDEYWLYLKQETVQNEIDQFCNDTYYDTVLTTIQTDGEENDNRNMHISGYGELEVILGLKTAGLESEMGYSTFNLGEPAPGTYPLDDPEIPSLYVTVVAIHEWMHQLEYMGEMLDIEYPSTHAYEGPETFPGYQEYVQDLNDYDYLEFYRPVLQGKLPYTGDGKLKHVGMYPKMWKLIRRDVLNQGTFTITNPDGKYLALNAEGTGLTLSDTECRWFILYGLEGNYIFVPEQDRELRMDLAEGWDKEGNPVHLYIRNPDYRDAQRWKIKENADQTYCICTAYSSGRALTFSDPLDDPTIQTIAGIPEKTQKWTITRLER